MLRTQKTQAQDPLVLSKVGAVCSSVKLELVPGRHGLALQAMRTRNKSPGSRWVKDGRHSEKDGRRRGVDKISHALTMSELKGFTLAWRLELLVRDQTLVLCLKAALTFKGRMEGSMEAISEMEKATIRGHSKRS